MPIARTVICLLALLIGVPPAYAQASGVPADLAASGRFRDQDTVPGSFRFYQQLPGGAGGLWGLGPTRTEIKRTSFKLDAHDTVADYSPRRLCQDCHQPQTKDLHGLRMGIACTQCHRSQPVAGVFHYFSSLNPIRRHAYVCAKCHEGATPSFASYLVHEPNPLAADARDEFPLLYWVTWIMVILAGGVLAFFLPYTALWCLRDWSAKLMGRSGHG